MITQYDWWSLLDLLNKEENYTDWVQVNLTFYIVTLFERIDQDSVGAQIYRVNLVIKLTFSSYQNSRCLKLSWTSNDSLKDKMSQNY